MFEPYIPPIADELRNEILHIDLPLLGETEVLATYTVHPPQPPSYAFAGSPAYVDDIELSFPPEEIARIARIFAAEAVSRGLADRLLQIELDKDRQAFELSVEAELC